MANHERRYSKEEFARRGDAIYEAKVRPKLKADEIGKFAAIDIESEEYEIANTRIDASKNLRARLPDAQIWMMRAGFPYVASFRRNQVCAGTALLQQVGQKNAG